MIFKIFDYLKERPLVKWGTLLITTILLVLLILKINYKEDISDFLPLGTDDRIALSVYQDISGANRIFILFRNPGDNDLTVSAVNKFSDIFIGKDTAGLIKDYTSQFDLESISEIAGFVYGNIPYFLTENDYKRIDSLLSKDNFVDSMLQNDHLSLLFPSAGFISENIGKDPLGLFTPVIKRLQGSNEQLAFEMYDGKIFTPDMQYAIAMMSSPYGSNETEKNSKLLSSIESSIKEMNIDYPTVEAHTAGGPKIAVGNASQIKKDSTIAVILAVVFILVLLIYAFRSIVNMFLIIVSITWGWIFALGLLSIFNDSISIIVIGISSVILGIAVNYPLHLIDHLKHEPNIRNTLKDIVAPLVIGNVTTVGAFLALVPLDSTALRDLGLFASLLLIGTILFVLVYLPHMIKVSALNKKVTESKLLSRITTIKLEDKKWIIVVVIILTAIFGYKSFDTSFDSNMSNINYMDKQTKEDLHYFQNLLAIDTTSKTRTLYVVSSDSSINNALLISESRKGYLDTLSKLECVTAYEGIGDFICSDAEQKRRIERWNRFTSDYSSYLSKAISEKSMQYGFRPEAFGEFISILRCNYTPQPYSFFEPLTKLVFSDNLSNSTFENRFSVVDKLQVKESQIDSLRECIPGSFDIISMNQAMAGSLSDDFNYIGWACSFIVFFFLWFSFGNLELATLSFLPMAVSWIWILGIMSIIGIKFNIVNIILATFIFGQGDDYTIFITEGCCYEHAYKRPILTSYKNSIILSALIMFIGIGTLIVAKHPALKSLAEVTIIGMFSVVLMAYILPPLVFKWIVSKNGKKRLRPIKISSIARTIISGAWWIFQLTITYIFTATIFCISGKNDKSRKVVHRLVMIIHRMDLWMFPTVKAEIRNPHNETFEKPSIIVANHQSMIDPICLMALSPKILIVANKHSSHNPVIRLLFKWLDFYTISDNFEKDIEYFKEFIRKGYSFVVFPEGVRNPESSIQRFHKGAFLLANTLGVDILPVVIHGINDLMPIHSFTCEKGRITISIEQRIEPRGNDTREITKYVHKFFIDRYEELRNEIEDADYYIPFVKDQYLYKGVDIAKEVANNLKRYKKYVQKTDKIAVINSGLGEFGMLMSLVNRNAAIVEYENDELKRMVATNAYDKVSIKTKESISEDNLLGYSVFIIHPSDEDIERFGYLSPTYLN